MEVSTTGPCLANLRDKVGQERKRTSVLLDGPEGQRGVMARFGSRGREGRLSPREKSPRTLTDEEGVTAHKNFDSGRAFVTSKIQFRLEIR